MRICGGGIDSFLGFEYCVVITLASREFRVLLTILPTSLRYLRHFWLRQGRMVLRPQLYCLPSRSLGSLYWVFRLVWRSSRLLLRWPRSLGRLQCQFFCLALCSAAVVAVFSPSFVIFALVWGLPVLSLEFSLLFLGYTFGVAFFAPSVYSPLLSLLR